MQSNVNEPDAVAPGTVLRQARTDRGLSIDEVAQSLRLSPRIVSALEEDAYERLPGPTYVRGYLRSYAQFLGLPAHPLIEGFNNRPEARKRSEIKGRAPVRQATSSDAMVRLASVVVAVVFFGLAALWWTGHDTSFGSRAPESVVAEPVFEAPPRPEAAAEAVPDDSAPVATARAPEAAEFAEEPAPSEPVAPELAEAPAPAAPESAAPEPRAPQAAAAERESVVRGPADDAGAPRSRLVLYVHDDSWADVRDARGERLLYQTIPAGRVVTIEGVAPLSVFLGNVRGVTVEFNGEEYDAARHRRGDVARFTLGSQSG